MHAFRIGGGGGKRDVQEIQSQRNLAKFMKILTVKRLESSFTAFLSTLGRFILTYERVITEFHKGHVFISKKHTSKIFELLESDNQNGIDRLLEEEKAGREVFKVATECGVTYPNHGGDGGARNALVFPRLRVLLLPHECRHRGWNDQSHSRQPASK